MAYPARTDKVRYLRGNQIANEYDGLNEDPLADSNVRIDGLNSIECLMNLAHETTEL